jgi:hypothetical protein
MAMEKSFRKVNQSLGNKPNIGPFPADQFIPWAVIAGGAYYLFKVLLGLSWLWTGLLAAWGMATWWVLTGSKPWRFLSKFIGTPYWVRGYGLYRPLLHRQRNRNSKKRS